MKLLSFVIALSCMAFGSTLDASDRKEHWEYSEDKVTLFMADMGIQWGVTYVTKDGKNTSQKVTSFGTNSTINGTEVKGTMDIIIEDSGVVLNLRYALDKGDYFLQDVTLMYKADAKTFPDAKYTENVTLSGETLTLFKTKEKMSYGCSIELQSSLNSSESTVTKAYLNFMPPSGSNKMLQLQAFNLTAEDKYDAASPCLWDSRDLVPEIQTFTVKDGKKNACAMMQTALMLDATYDTIDGKTMDTKIPVKTTADLTGTCDDKNVTTMQIMLDNIVGTLSLEFSIVSEKLYYYGVVDEAILSSFQLKYNPTIDYFPNFATGSEQTLKNASLSEFSTSVGSSYQCLAPSDVMVTAQLTASFNQTRIQAFGIKDGNFSKVDADCQAKPSVNTTAAPTTTQAPTTTTPFIPIPVEPAISNRTIVDKDNKNITCLHGLFGLQLFIRYNDTGFHMTDAAYNFDAENVTTVASCNASMATVNFSRKDGVEVTLVFSKASSKTYLSKVMAKYDANKLPGHKKESSGAKQPEAMVHNFETPSNNSYHCSEGTDVFVSDSDDFVALRLDGLKLEAFPAKADYAPASKCFRDMPAVKADSGNYFINSTDKKTVCAAFTMTINAMVTYPQLVNENMRTVYIEVPGNSNTPKDDSFGTCGKDNTTTLKIHLDDSKVKFILTFKQNMTVTSLTDIQLVYQTDSKYFPNHARVSGGTVTLRNNTLKMFPSDVTHSYKCNQNVTTIVTPGKVFMAGVQVQPMGVDKDDGSFKSALSCDSPSSGLSKTAKIAIISAIGVVALVLIIGIGICCRRKLKQRKLGYKAFD